MDSCPPPQRQITDNRDEQTRTLIGAVRELNAPFICIVAQLRRARPSLTEGKAFMRHQQRHGGGGGGCFLITFTFELIVTVIVSPL